MFTVINNSVYISFSEEELSCLICCVEDSGDTGLAADLLLRLRNIQVSVSSGQADEIDFDEIPF